MDSLPEQPTKHLGIDRPGILRELSSILLEWQRGGLHDNQVRCPFTGERDDPNAGWDPSSQRHLLPRP